ncbi:MAG: hypothetical protein QME52_11025 [Bacteroidota bacterium]|nr:hypothetical protein [Bacteroidota bacterium]
MIQSSLIGHVVQLLEHIDAEDKPPDHLTGEFFRQKKYLGAHDRRFISEIIYGMIRHRRLIKTLIKQFIKHAPSAISMEGPHVRYVAQFAVFVFTVDKGAFVPPHLWMTYFPKIDLQHFREWIEQNHSLQTEPEDKITHLGVRYSYQDWMVKEWLEQIGDGAELLLDALNKPAPTTIRVNLLRASRDECQHRLHEEGIETEKTSISPCGLIAKKRFNIQSLKSFQDGLFEMQDEGSQLISIIADPKPGQLVIDGCAGGGGKSLHMAELMQNKGEIIAVDISGGRLKELLTRSDRAGVNIIKTKLAGKINAETFISKADLVMVDAPCSGVGTIRRNPYLKWSVSESLVQHYVQKQKQILQNNVRFVKPGGRLLYATCSLFRQENENVVISFQDNNPTFRLSRFDGFSKNFDFKPDSPYLTLYPHLYNTDGFFVALFTRVE